MFGNEKTKKTVIGIRPGEKIHEVLVSKNESPRTKVFNDKYYVILPQFKGRQLDDRYREFEKIEHEEFNSNNAQRLENPEFVEILKKEPWLWEENPSSVSVQ